MLASLVCRVGCIAIGVGALLTACDDSEKPLSSAGALGAGGDGVDHSKHDCNVAHPRGGDQAPDTLALSKDARQRLTRLRISSHRSSVTLRKHELGWEIGGQGGCVVDDQRVERALDVLTGLKAKKTPERPTSGGDFKLSIIAHADIDPVLHMDIAGKRKTGHLVQTGALSTYVVQNLDFELLSSRVSDWCPIATGER